MSRPTVDPKRTSVKAHYIDDWPEDGYGDPGACLRASGDANYPDHLVFCCPGCGRFGSIRATHPKQENPKSWDITAGSLADVTTLTLAPSIHCVGCCGWHGWLRNGVFESV